MQRVETRVKNGELQKRFYDALSGVWGPWMTTI